MAKDKLKQHVTANRDAFELYEFDRDQVWDQVSKSLDQNTKTVQVPIKYIWRAVGSIVLLVGISAYLLFNSFYNNDGTLAFNHVSPELVEAQEYYGTMIDHKIQQIKRSQPEMDPAIYEDIEALDKAFRELKEDLKDNADNEEVINAMIYNYKLKLEILEKILIEIGEVKKDNAANGLLN